MTREERQIPRSNPEDQRNSFQVDRDRLIYSFAFRRLAQVTQVASAREVGIFHNRLTHSLKVAQVGRRLAEYLLEKTSANVINQWGGLSPDVVEAACLAHDLGHPPFGHIGEKTLDELARKAGLKDGFEGNAQTFRILTKLEPHKPNHTGLNLTRATLDATLKYPWLRELDSNNQPTFNKKSQKFSVYNLDQDVFKFVRQDQEYRDSGKQSLEASIMDFADDITYSVHDFEDFYLAGLIPLNTLIQNFSLFNQFVEDWEQSIKNNDHQLKNQLKDLQEKERLREFLSLYLPSVYTTKNLDEITYVRSKSSLLIQKYIQSSSISQEYGKYGCLQRDFNKEIELKLLQRIVWKYVMTNSSLAIQHYGQKGLITQLFNIYTKAIEEEQYNLLPSRFLKDGLKPITLKGDNTYAEAERKLRLAVDIVASLSESEAVSLYRRFTSLEQGSIMDYIG